MRSSEPRPKPHIPSAYMAHPPPTRGRGSRNRRRGLQQGFSRDPHHLEQGYTRDPHYYESPRRPSSSWHDYRDDYRHDGYENQYGTPTHFYDR